MFLRRSDADPYPLITNQGTGETLVNNENLTEFSMPVMGAGKGGKSDLRYEIKLVNANIASIDYKTSDDPKLPDTLEITFTYQRIEWTWVDGGITAMDDWEAPVAVGAPKKPKGK